MYCHEYEKNNGEEGQNCLEEALCDNKTGNKTSDMHGTEATEGINQRTYKVLDDRTKSFYKWAVKEKEIDDYLFRALVAAAFFSITFGIIAVVFSGMTKAEKTAGNSVQAAVYSEKARLFSRVSIAVGCVKYLFSAVAFLCAIRYSSF